MKQVTKEQEIIENNSLDIHGKSYLTVAGRLQLMQEDVKTNDWTYQLRNEVLFQSPVTVLSRLVILDKDGHVMKDTTGISAANPNKTIEKMSPYEVAETSAVGRALGFAGYGVIDSIASADEMRKAGEPLPWESHEEEEMRESVDETMANPKPLPGVPCPICGGPTTFKEGTSKAGKHYKGYFCESGEKNHVQWAK